MPAADRRLRRLRIALGLAILAVAVLAGADVIPGLAPWSIFDSCQGTVTHVVDGDTLEVAGVGTVRLIGIDALDAHNRERTTEQATALGMPADEVRAWSEEAAAFARDMLSGSTVVLELGPDERDRYGRALRYLRLEDGRDFNLLMIQRGLATAYRRFPHPRLDAYIRAEAEARSLRRGLWQDAAGAADVD